MGEIADALKKANAERLRERDAAPVPPPTPKSDPEADAESVARGWSDHDTDEAPRAASPAPPVAPVPVTAPAPRTIRERVQQRAATTPTDPAPQSAPEHSSESITLPAVELDGEPPQVDLTRHLALRLKSELERRNARSVMIASPLRNEGKTTVSCNIAIALASVSGSRGIALVDLDLRNPSIGKRMAIPVKRGIDEVITGAVALKEACHALSEPRIDVYPCLNPHPAAHELLASDGFRRAIQELHAQYDVVVIDSPPTLLVPDSTLILREVDTCVTVAHAGISRVRMFTKMLSMLPADRVIGKVLNAAHAEKHQRDYYAYGYGADEDDEQPGPQIKKGKKSKRKREQPS